MTSKFEESFCNGSFWNVNLTWNSEHPDFTNCFQRTVIAWIPITVLVFFSLFEVPNYYSSKNPNRNIPWSVLNAIKLCSTASLVMVNVAELVVIIVTSSDDDPLTSVYPVDYVAASVFLTSYLLSLGVLILALKYGIRTSPAQFLFYLVSVLCEGVNFRSIVRRKTHPEEEESFVPFSEDGTDILLCLVSIQYGLIIILFLSNFFSDKEPQIYDETLKNVSNLSPEMSASFPSKLTFFWATSLMWKGYKNPLEPSMLWSMNPKITSRGIVPLFDSCFNQEVEKANRKNPPEKNKDSDKNSIDKKEIRKARISILWPLIKTFGPEFFIGSCHKVCYDLLVMATPQIMSLMIDFVETKYCDTTVKDNECNLEDMENAYDWKGYFFAGLMLATTICQSIILNQYFVRMFIVSMNIRTAMISAIYRKALVMSNSARKESTVGEIVNLMSVDIQRFMVRRNTINVLCALKFILNVIRITANFNILTSYFRI